MSTEKNTLPCCIDVPVEFRKKTSYAIRMLVEPLGLEPKWVSPDTFPSKGLYYGIEARKNQKTLVSIRLTPKTVSFFNDKKPLSPNRITWVNWNEIRCPVLFYGYRTEPDLVASTFFLISGWQEHIQPIRDKHGRFPFEMSMQACLGTSTLPVVDVYREILAEKLIAAGFTLQRRRWNGKDWAICPTHDIDYLRKWHPGIIYREVVHYLIKNHRREPLSDRLRRFGGIVNSWIHTKDPYVEAFTRIQEEIKKRGGTGTFFIKTKARDPHDVFYSLKGRQIRTRLSELKTADFEIGFHPSYLAHTSSSLLEEEVTLFIDAIGKRPESVRHHYLRYESPATAVLHEKLGFKIDSTLGFAEHEGFRHGTCLPFQIYDIEQDRALNVWEMPLAVMESTLFNHRSLSSEEADDVTTHILETCRRFGGVCVLLWHNTLWDERDYPGWGQHFLDTLDKAVKEKALISSVTNAFSSWK